MTMTGDKKTKNKKKNNNHYYDNNNGCGRKEGGFLLYAFLCEVSEPLEETRGGGAARVVGRSNQIILQQLQGAFKLSGRNRTFTTKLLRLFVHVFEKGREGGEGDEAKRWAKSIRKTTLVRWDFQCVHAFQRKYGFKTTN